ncbi:MAG: hypothetical protein K9L68_08850 [Spirochaetales bacterium]|nr:hypothetical protein [Spirochaetales bacterium]MCF7938693.1 hypothetical protein [Spirochaetales bacterium]
MHFAGKLIYIFAGFWYLLHFVLLYFLIQNHLPVGSIPSLSLLLLWLGGGSLAIFIGFLVYALQPHRYASYLPLLKIASLLVLFPGLIYVAFQITSILLNQPGIMNGRSVLLPVAIAAVDLLFFIILLILKPITHAKQKKDGRVHDNTSGKDSTDSSYSDRHLPKLEETIVQEE